MPALLLGPVLRHVERGSATVWVETDRACTVEVRLESPPAEADQQRAGGSNAVAAPTLVASGQAPTFAVSGHHYALVVVPGLAEATDCPYRVYLDEECVWPPREGELAAYPPSRIRTPASAGPVRLVLGSCRYASPADAAPNRYGRDCLDAVAQSLRESAPARWPHLLLLLGDQVYADEISSAVRQRVDARRGRRSEPRGQVADFEEYTWLYLESWADPPVRWLLSTVPTAMIFDDHDIHDDWNTSVRWRQEKAAEPWWRERVLGGLMTYFVYQHLGNMSPAELQADPTARRVLGLDDPGRGPGVDVEPVLRRLAAAADAEADGGKGYRWSYARTVGRTRVVVLDSRCGRIMDGGDRLMLSDEEFSWAEEQMLAGGEADHLVVATSLPWLLPPALHDIEGWNERLCARTDSRLRARIGEAMRRAADLEHWAAFGVSFERLSAALRNAALGGPSGGTPPATVCVVSGDVHHSYVGQALVPQAPGSRIYQVTCSPLHNRVPLLMQLAFRLSWHPRAEKAVRALLSRSAPVPGERVALRRIAGPVFGNAVATLDHDGPTARLRLHSTEHGHGNELTELLSLRL